jgi:hypothetical protein
MTVVAEPSGPMPANRYSGTMDASASIVITLALVL